MQHHKTALESIKYMCRVRLFVFIQEETIIIIICIIYLLPKPSRQLKNSTKNIGTVPEHQGFEAWPVFGRLRHREFFS